MGMIKRAIQRTSRKLLSKIVPPTSSHELVLNPPLQADDFASPTDQRSLNKLVSLKRKFRRSSKDTAMEEALLLAVKNHLPPVQFHHIHGPNVQLAKNKCVARRTQSFCQALVFSNRVILPNERVYIKVLEIAKGWSGTIRFGFTAVDPATLARRMPKHACPDMTNAGHTWARALADEVVRRNSVIHFSYNKNGLIHYGINNQDCGVFHANVSTSQNLWFIVDIYGLTAAVELIDPRVNGAGSSEIDISQLDDSLGTSLNRSTMFKSTSAMDEIFGRYSASETRSRKKQSRKQAARQAAMIQSNWALANSMGGGQFVGLAPPSSQHCPRMQLPNLNSVNLPSAQQNIYSPMPNGSHQDSSLRAPAADLHDYHQIYSRTTCPSISQQQVSRLANVPVPPQALASASSSFPVYSSVSNSSSNGIAEQQISQRLESIHFHDKNTRHQQQPKHSTPKSSRPDGQQAPVASTRKRLQQQPSSSQTNSKRTLDAPDKTVAIRSGFNKSASSAPSASKSTISSHSTEKSPKTRHSIKSQKSSTSSDRDKNNNSPPSKDCPICFERPINCVLYQCGHMCTCYECGVKQWKTQSRTCPICRTIIKDVIKTYMS